MMNCGVRAVRHIHPSIHGSRPVAGSSCLSMLPARRCALRCIALRRHRRPGAWLQASKRHRHYEYIGEPELPSPSGAARQLQQYKPSVFFNDGRALRVGRGLRQGQSSQAMESTPGQHQGSSCHQVP